MHLGLVHVFVSWFVSRNRPQFSMLDTVANQSSGIGPSIKFAVSEDEILMNISSRIRNRSLCKSSFRHYT